MISRKDISREMLEQLYNTNGLSTRQISERLGCSGDTIRNRMKEAGLPRRKPGGGFRRVELPDEILGQLYAGGLTQAQIAVQLGTTKTVIQKRMAQLGIPGRRIGRPGAYCLSQAVYSKWSPELAYAVGLIATDGNLHSQDNAVVLSSSEQEQIDNYTRCLRISIPLTKHFKPGYKVVYSVKVYDRAFRAFLESIGLTPRKSLTIGALKIPDEFFRDFLRGCIDGDGSLDLSESKYLRVRLFSASLPFLEWIGASVSRLIGYAPRCTKGNSCGVYALSWLRRAEVDRLLNWLYSLDVPALSRKRAVWEAWQRQTSNSSP